VRHYCENCGTERLYRFVGEYVDEHGRTVEMYRCSVCGTERSVIVG
jgi:ribosomal protein S14